MPKHNDRAANWGYAVICYDKNRSPTDLTLEQDPTPPPSFVERLRQTYRRLVWQGQPEARTVQIECVKVRSAAVRVTSDALRRQGHHIVEVFPGIEDEQFAKTLESELPGSYICFTVSQLKAALSSQSMVLMPPQAYAEEREQPVWLEEES